MKSLMAVFISVFALTVSVGALGAEKQLTCAQFFDDPDIEGKLEGGASVIYKVIFNPEDFSKTARTLSFTSISDYLYKGKDIGGDGRTERTSIVDYVVSPSEMVFTVSGYYVVNTYRVDRSTLVLTIADKPISAQCEISDLEVPKNRAF